MKASVIISAVPAIGKTWVAWRAARAEKKRDRAETRAWLADWQCGKVNAELRDRIKFDKTIKRTTGANPTTRIDLTKRKPAKAEKDGGK